jgi:hypothetical protein
VEGVEDAAVFFVRRLDERLERLQRLGLLTRLGLERPDHDHFRHAILFFSNDALIVRINTRERR